MTDSELIAHLTAMLIRSRGFMPQRPIEQHPLAGPITVEDVDAAIVLGQEHA
jgi:hypothetical protein